MRYIRFVITIMVTLFSLSVYGQTQRGYVKTLGRPEAKGAALSDVTIKVKGEHNPVKSNGDGVFTIQFQNKKNGDAYALQEVRKVGYELNEPEVVGRQFAVSDKVRSTIVMVSTAQLQADKQRIENNAYKVAEKNYKQKLALLEKEKEDGTITVEKYREQLQELQNRFEKYQSLIDGLAEHYAHTDYDELNEKEQEINICIENGELERADSLIQLLFDPIDVLKRNKEALAKLNEQISQAEDIIDQANDDMAAVLKQQDKDAEHLYQLYTIALARFDNEQAGRYIEIRAKLDSTNVRWQNDAGLFVDKYYANYSKALEYYQLAIRHALSKYGNQSEWESILYKNIGGIFVEKAEYSKALSFYERALDIAKELVGEEDPSIALFYNEIGTLYAIQDKYDMATDYFMKSSVILEHTIGIDNEVAARLFNNIGSIYSSLGNHKEAIKFYEEALRIYAIFDKVQDIATSYNNIGICFFQQGEYKRALEYTTRALEMEIEIYKMKHPKVADSYINIGGINEQLGCYQQAIENYEKALRIYEQIMNFKHPRIASVLNRIGLIFQKTGNLTIAKEYYEKAISVLPEEFQNNSIMAFLLNNIGGLYHEQGEYQNALENHKKALEIRKSIYGNDHPEVADSYNNIGLVYYELDDYPKALEYYGEALSIQEKFLGKNHPDVALSFNNIGSIYRRQGDGSKALEFYEQALLIYERIYGSKHPDVALAYNNIGGCYNEIGNYYKSLDYLKKALVIMEKIYGNIHPNIASTYGNIGDVYCNLQDYSKALDYFNKELSLREQIFGKEHINTGHSYYNIANTYKKQGNDKEAIVFFKKAKNVFEKALGHKHAYTETIIKLMYEEALKGRNLNEFLASNVFTATVIDGFTPAKEQGMSGEYILLEFADWKQDSPISLFNKNKEMKGKPKNILVMKDGKISKHHFENQIGAQLGIKEVANEERIQINKIYEQWKIQNRN